MEIEEIYSFLNTTADKHTACWNLEQLSKIANQRFPDFIMGNRSTLIRADTHLLWTEWFLDSICDPEIFSTNEDSSYALILEIVKERISTIFFDISKNHRQELIRDIARLIDKKVQLRKNRERSTLSRDEKKELWDLSGPDQRCWICGYKFTNWAEHKFLGSKGNITVPPLPKFVDYMTFHGLKARDIVIDIDHAIPFSQGGRDGDNLRLACGWCNSRKSNRISLYDVSAKPRTVKHPKLGSKSIPQPFWVVRLLSVRRCCEHEEGCDRVVENSQLTVVPKHPQGAMNPSNVKVTCLDHDPLGSDRFVSRQVAERMQT